MLIERRSSRRLMNHIYVVPYIGEAAAMLAEHSVTNIIASHMGVNPKVIQSLDSLEEDKP